MWKHKTSKVLAKYLLAYVQDTVTELYTEWLTKSEAYVEL